MLTNIEDVLKDQLDGALRILQIIDGFAERGAPVLTDLVKRLNAISESPEAVAFREARFLEREEAHQRRCKRRIDLVAGAIKAGITEHAALQILFSVYPETPANADGLTDKLLAALQPVLNLSNLVPIPDAVPDLSVLDPEVTSEVDSEVTYAPAANVPASDDQP